MRIAAELRQVLTHITIALAPKSDLGQQRGDLARIDAARARPLEGRAGRVELALHQQNPAAQDMQAAVVGTQPERGQGMLLRATAQREQRIALRVAQMGQFPVIVRQRLVPGKGLRRRVVGGRCLLLAHARFDGFFLAVEQRIGEQAHLVVRIFQGQAQQGHGLLRRQRQRRDQRGHAPGRVGRVLQRTGQAAALEQAASRLRPLRFVRQAGNVRMLPAAGAHGLALAPPGGQQAQQAGHAQHRHEDAAQESEHRGAERRRAQPLGQQLAQRQRKHEAHARMGQRQGRQRRRQAHQPRQAAQQERIQHQRPGAQQAGTDTGHAAPLAAPGAGT